MKKKLKKGPVQIEIGEWYYKGCFIQEQIHPLLLKYHIFTDTLAQHTVGTTNSFKLAKLIAEQNEVKNPHYGLESFL